MACTWIGVTGLVHGAQQVRRQIELAEMSARRRACRLRRGRRLVERHLGGRWPFLAVLDVEHHAHARIDARSQALFEGGVMYENVITPGVGGDETKTLSCAVPFDGARQALRHR